MLFQNFTTTNTANIPATYGAFLSPGDELVSVDNGEHFWVIGDEEGTTASLKMIDHTGKLEPYYLGTVKVYRSGYRNQLGASTASITSLRNPVGKDGRIVFFNNAQLEQYGVLEARATLFDDRWGMPGCIQQPCPDGYVMGEDGNCYIPPEVEIDAPGMCGADSKDYYNVRGAAFYATLAATSTNDTLRNAVWGGSAGGAGNGAAQGRFSAAGVVLCPSPKGALPTGSTWDGYSRCFTVPDITSTYYLGMSSTANIRIYIDGVLVKERAQGLGAINYTRYHLYPITFTTAGQHTIAIETKTNGIAPGATQCAVEIYKASLSTLKTGTEQTVLNARIFTSYDMLQDIFNERKKTNVYVKNDAGTVLLRYLKCGTGAPSMCGMPNCGMVPGFDCAPGASQIPEQEKCVYYANKKTDAIYSIVRGSQVNDYGIYGTYFFDASNKLRDVKTNGFWGKCVAESTSSMAARTTAATDPEITYSSQAVQDTATGKSAARITAAAATTETFCGRLNNCGIWLGGDRAIHDGKWWSVKSCFYAPQSGMYYIGYAGDNNYRIKIDNGVIQNTWTRRTTVWCIGKYGRFT
ncbi:hypothetical protein MKQ70_14985 [Chitinophaga sedimenti]|uniref:hypothetical protein n=1 Tax=Chitinophaga sedimenti TaxID=2033606 RepID=UPI002005ABAB|nr:hypothetical protein [Chitinophaga sedimenti]MCK7556249.1 hypothetical protein [Chitinophaga sedimenti]